MHNVTNCGRKTGVSYSQVFITTSSQIIYL